VAGSAPTSTFSLDELLLTKMDEAVLEFARIMSDHATIKVGTGDTAREVLKYSFAEKMKAAEFVKDWIARRRKMVTTSGGDDEAVNITELRAAIREETLKTIQQQRLVRMPEKKNGRPTREEAAHRREVQEAITAAELAAQDPDQSDDTELQRVLAGGQ
jgi:hypothetical protein